MSRAQRKCYSSDVTQSPVPTWRRGMWLWASVLVAVLVCVTVAIVFRLQHTDGAATSSASGQESAHVAPAAASQDPLPETERRKLIGRWQRSDANYVLEIRDVAADGRIDAAYLNPQPIHVSKAIAASESGKTTIMVELRDRLYPGSYYILTYNARNDRLSGVYHHLGIHQDFDVVFVRMGRK